MRSARNHRRFLLWVALGTASMALAMASLLVFELAQKRAIDQSNAIRSDSLTALVFQFEREFLRLRHVIGETLLRPGALDTDELSLRNDIFQSRLTLMRESPSVSLLTSRAEYERVMPRVVHTIEELDQALAATPPNRNALGHVLGELNALGADVQALTLVADSEVAHRLESQIGTLRSQNVLIVWLTVAQLTLLVIAAGALVLRHRRQEVERRALEQITEELREAHTRAESANRAKSQFLANMSHELRTPFNGLMGMLGLLQGTSLTAQQTDYIETAQVSASHLLTLLNDILDLSALETGKMTLKPGTVDLARMLGDVNALMLPLARAKSLVFEITGELAALPPVQADETRLKQILFNLVNNAIKFTALGRVELQVSSRREGSALELVCAVSDTGIGMEPAVLSRLFQRFYRVNESGTRRFGGTGLGLEISQSLARMMNGEITVRSEPDVGSCFTATVRLPLATTPAEPEVPTEPAALAELPLTQPAALTRSEAPAQPVAGPAATGEAGAPTMHVLVVEDHPINQKLVGVLLGRMGCQVCYCGDGQQALDRVQQQPFDLILMDVNMPVMDGLDATRAIRALPGPVARTPIVVLTADVMNEAHDQALAAGADDFIGKPVKVDQLRALVLKHAAARTPA